MAYTSLKDFAKDMHSRFNISEDRALDDINSVLSDGYSLDSAVDGLIAVYSKEFNDSLDIELN